MELVPSACGFSLTPSSLSPSASGGTSAIAIGIATGCSWQAVSNDTWLTITSGSVGLGPGTVNFMIDPNPSLFPRVGTLTVAGQTFTVTQLPPPPGAPTLASPANGAGPVSLMPVLSWSAPAGTVSYDVYLGTTNPPALATNVTVNSYTPAALAQGQTYYWQIVAMNSGGSASSPVWTFTTVVPTFSKYNVSVIPPPNGVLVISMAGINDSGQVGGFGYKTSGGYVAFDGSPSGSTVLPFNLVEAVFGINESGQVAGYCCNLGGGDYAYIAGATGGTQIPLPSGYVLSEGYGVNNAGQVGGSVLTASTEQAFIGTSSGLTSLPLPSGCTSASGWAINNLGQVLEKCVTQLFIGTPEATTALPPMPEAQIYPYAINDLGQIAGYYDNGGQMLFSRQHRPLL